MAVTIDPAILGQEFDHAEVGPVTAEELIAFARSVGETRPEYTTEGPNLIAHPTYCVRWRGSKFYPENLPKAINLRTGFDAGKDIELGEPIRPGDTVAIRCTLHDIYEKTGRSGSMVFVVLRFTVTNQRGETVAVVDNRFMHR